MQPILSILIPVINRHIGMLGLLLHSLNSQMLLHGLQREVEIIIEDGEIEPTGKKRNTLLNKASGQYIVFIDADDEVSEDYLSEVILGCKNNPDVISFNGWITTNGKDKVKWFIGKDLPYIESSHPATGEKVYLRYNNHLSPVKREIALQIGFPDITIGEDYDYATRLKDSGLIKTEYKIDKQLYFYKFVSNKL